MIRAFGKTILLGEHSVVRGHPAVVLPLKSRSLELRYERKEGSGLTVHAGEFAPAFQAALEEGLRLLGKSLPAGRWNFQLSSDVPPQAGMGSSAALSVALTRFFAELGLVSEPYFPFALSLENLFHGKSSGLDVAAVLEAQPIRFQKGQSQRLGLAWWPKLFLADTNLRSSTKACVMAVAEMNRPDLDEKNAHAVEMGIEALADPQGLPKLVQAFDLSLSCFREWKLVPASVEAQISALKKMGALAVKPTGSGNGGFLLTLWDREAPPSLIPVSADS